MSSAAAPAVAAATYGHRRTSVDLNGFKDVNDTYGHHVGDELLIAVAQRLAASARQSDCVARLGGDEFAVILADVASAADACAIVDRIGRALDQPVRLAERTLHVGASIGVAHSGDGRDIGTLLRLADGAMYRAKYRAKRHGRDRRVAALASVTQRTGEQ